MATAHHDEPEGRDATLVVDIDLAILGTDPARFAEYEQQVRAEYAEVPTGLLTSTRGSAANCSGLFLRDP